MTGAHKIARYYAGPVNITRLAEALKRVVVRVTLMD